MTAGETSRVAASNLAVLKITGCTILLAGDLVYKKSTNGLGGICLPGVLEKEVLKTLLTPPGCWLARPQLRMAVHSFCLGSNLHCGGRSKVRHLGLSH